MNDYYVYAYLREDGTPYYIGKGKGRRIKDKRGRNATPPNDISRIVKLHENLTEGEAFQKEKELIKLYGRKDLGTGILRNLTDGGEGASNKNPETLEKLRIAGRNRIYSEETKRKISKSNKGKVITPESIKRMVETRMKNGNYKVSEETRKKISESNKGRIKSEEERKNISEGLRKNVKIGKDNALYGRKRPEEWKKEQSIRIKQWHADRKKSKSSESSLEKNLGISNT
jgi:hypothetical protein